LFRHEERIGRLRVELECDSKQAAQRFTVKGHLQLQGPDCNASVSADECHKAIAMLIDKLDRMLERRARMLKSKRNHPHAVDLEVALPKAI
jgi:putative sigma-54 modulation protein